ncbi:hypothetical protein PROFUN_10960 [Planoprotostelium fungivorum]|uniref:Uncharacterized protein n=1 Tax=Planoprotostelium fungivorum TaxID=1890364 RepID=A0A2P6NBV7_9EUKA|nr:hypothetical protein PROFUN_10960 [Planoprotostelium fungivorum]
MVKPKLFDQLAQQPQFLVPDGTELSPPDINLDPPPSKRRQERSVAKIILLLSACIAVGFVSVMMSHRPREVASATASCPPVLPLLLVTGASSNHFDALRGWLLRMRRILNEGKPKSRGRGNLGALGECLGKFSSLKIEVVIYDLGLTEEQANDLDKIIYGRHAGKSSKAPTPEYHFVKRIERFQFENYPRHVNISNYDEMTQEYTRGHWAWKPIIIHEEWAKMSNKLARGQDQLSNRALLVWSDSGNAITDEYLLSLEHLVYHQWRIGGRPGFFSPHRGYPLPYWTHRDAMVYFNVTPSQESRPGVRWSEVGMCTAGLVAFDINLASPLIQSWRDCAMKVECIAPLGSNRKNHRQDEPPLTMISEQQQHQPCNVREYDVGVWTNMDDVVEDWIKMEENLWREQNRLWDHREKNQWWLKPPSG